MMSVDIMMSLIFRCRHHDESEHNDGRVSPLVNKGEPHFANTYLLCFSWTLPYNPRDSLHDNWLSNRALKRLFNPNVLLIIGHWKSKSISYV
jgi:hypothetical protein